MESQPTAATASPAARARGKRVAELQQRVAALDEPRQPGARSARAEDAVLARAELARGHAGQRGGGAAHAAQQHLVPAHESAPAAAPADDRGRDRDLACGDRPGHEEGTFQGGHSSVSPMRGSAWSAAMSGARRFTASTASVHDGSRPEVSKTCSCPTLTGSGRRRHISSVVTMSFSIPHHVGHAGDTTVPGAQPRKLDHEIDAPRDLAPERGERDVAAARHQHVLEPDERVARVVRVQRAHRARVPGVHRLEHLVGLGPAHLADDDAVGAHPKRVHQQVAHRHLARALRAHGSRLQPDHVRLLELQLRRVLDGDEPLAVGDLARECVHERGLARPGAGR